MFCSINSSNLFIIIDKFLFLKKGGNNKDAIYDVQTSWVKDVNGKRIIVRYFIHQLLKYVWDDRENGFKCLQGLDNGTTTLSKLLEKCHGLTADEHESQYANKINFTLLLKTKINIIDQKHHNIVNW